MLKTQCLPKWKLFVPVNYYRKYLCHIFAFGSFGKVILFFLLCFFGGGEKKRRGEVNKFM